jgi:hypothetical protein
MGAGEANWETTLDGSGEMVGTNKLFELVLSLCGGSAGAEMRTGESETGAQLCAVSCRTTGAATGDCTACAATEAAVEAGGDAGAAACAFSSCLFSTLAFGLKIKRTPVKLAQEKRDGAE